jgi:hypothetical protein
VQAANRLPDQIRDYKPNYRTHDEGALASIDRRFFEDERKWGYEVAIAGEKVGRLTFVDDKMWILMPSAGRLAEREIRQSTHASPISAFVRVQSAWRRALAGQGEAPAAAPTAETAAA